MSDIAHHLGITVHVNSDSETAISRVTEALKTEGFGVLTEIDVQATLKQKLDVNFRPYTILGACNPTLAYRALQAAPEVGLLLPCNVTLAQRDDGTVDISLVDPISMLNVVNNPTLKTIAQEARERLERVAASLQS